MERPILFSTDMVQALLAGRKTQTRRILKPQPPQQFSNFGGAIAFVTEKTLNHTVLCPFGRPGNLLWVRESWQLTGWNLEEAEMQIKYQAGGTLWTDLHCPNESFDWFENQIEQLEAKGIIKQSPGNDDFFEFTDKPQPWKPNIHMPKSAARIWLKVTNVRVERLQDISNIDALEEGIETGPMETDPFSKETLPTYKIYGEVDRFIWTLPAVSFKSLWRSINGPDSWEVNPWVWVVEFEVVSTTGRANVKEERA